jgi:Flp pilus assembly protein TadG
MNTETKSGKIGRIIRDESGSEQIEFALSAMVVLVLLFGVMDFCRAMYAYHFVSYAAQEAARYAVVRGHDFHGSSCQTSTYSCEAQQTDVQSYVTSLSLPLINSSKLVATATWPGTTPTCTGKSGSCSACSGTNNANSSGCYVNVKVSYTFSFITPFLPKSASFHFSGSSEQVIQE